MRLSHAASVLAMTALALAIVGGRDADIRQFGFQVSLQLDNKHLCGGSIVSPRHIVTAAHCVTDPAERLSVRAGSHEHALGGQLVNVSSLAQHPKYKRMKAAHDFDIAVVTLSHDLSFEDGVRPIQLADGTAGLPREGSQGIVSGWGLTSHRGSLSPRLQYLHVDVVNRTLCMYNYKRLNLSLTESMFCAGTFEGGRDACTKDSGGPLVDVDSGRLIGFPSWGEECAKRHYPGVYGSISILHDFIVDKIGRPAPMSLNSGSGWFEFESF